MSRTVQASFKVTFTTLEEYQTAVTNLTNYENNPNNTPLASKTLDEMNKQIDFIINHTTP